MGDEDAERPQPSLELPKLGLRRRKPKPTPEPAEPTPVSGGFGSVPAAQTEPNPPPPEPEAEQPQPRIRRERGPGGMVVVLAVGLVVGLGIVGLTWASLQGCEKVQGTSSCGQAGYGLLTVILVAMVVVGTLLLRLARVAEPGTTSFLAVGLASVLALLALVDHLTDRSMLVVIPLLSAACYAAAHWVTRTFADAGRR